MLHLWFTLPRQRSLLLRLSQQSLLQQQRLLQLQLLQQQHPNLQLPALLREHQRRRRNRHRHQRRNQMVLKSPEFHQPYSIPYFQLH